MNRAIAHKDYACRGGGERLAETMAATLDCPLYVGQFTLSNYDTEAQIDVRELFGKSWQQRLIDRGGLVRSIAYRYLWQQDTEPLHKYDTVILSGNEPLWYVGPDEQTTVAYTHSTPRHLYDLFPDVENTPLGRVWQIILEQQRTWYHSHTKKPDLWVANSELVARRLQKYWDVDQQDIRVVYPPVDVKSYSHTRRPTGDYYLVVSRLVPAKQTAWVVEQANRLKLPLKIAGKGPELETIRDMAGPTVDVLGYVSEGRKRELLSGAKAFIMAAKNEDFGMTPIEALASGTPVVGVNDGYTKYQIKDGQHGVLFNRTPESFASAINRLEETGFSEAELMDYATRFGKRQFVEGIKTAVREAERRSEVTPAYDTDCESSNIETEVATDGHGE